MDYSPKLKLTQDVRRDLLVELSSASDGWRTYASRITESFAAAYAYHEAAVNEISERSKTNDAGTAWALALVCVALTGGLVGGILAPWAAVGSVAARTGAAAIAGSVTQSLAQKQIDIAYGGSAPPPPPMMKPDQFGPHLQANVGMYALTLKKAIDEALRAFDTADRIDVAGVANWKAAVLDDMFITQQPGSDDIPDKLWLANLIEWGLWLVWANFRDFKYWKEYKTTLDYMINHQYSVLSCRRKNVVDSLAGPLQEFHLLDPVVRRLEALGKDKGVVFYVDEAEMALKRNCKAPAKAVKLLDINRLRVAGAIGPGITADHIFINNLLPAIRTPEIVFARLRDLQAVHLRLGKSRASPSPAAPSRAPSPPRHAN